MTTQGNYALHVANGGCPFVNGDTFCQDILHHEQAPPIGRGNLHWAKLFSPKTGSETREWP